MDRAEWRAAAAAALLASVASFALMTTDLIGFFFDDAIYALVAKALAAGDGFVYPHLPGEPAATHYPPLWPLLLSVVWKLGPPFPHNAGWLRMVNPLLAGFAAGLTLLAATRVLRFAPWTAFALVGLAFLTIPVQFLVNALLSETLFLALLALSVVLAHRAQQRGGLAWWAVTGVALGLLVLTRTLGVAVALAVLATLVWGRRWREMVAVTVPLVLLMLPWQLYVARTSGSVPPEIAGSYGPYLEWVLRGYRADGVGLVWQVVTLNLYDTQKFLGFVLQPMGAVAWRHALTALAVVAFGAGTAVLVRQPAGRIIGLSLLGYVALVIGWPFQVERFLWGAWPWFAMAVAVGLRAAWALATASPRRAWRVAVAAVGVALALGHAAYNVHGIARGFVGSSARRLSLRNLALVRVVNAHEALHGSVLAADAAPMLALYSGQQVVPVGDLRVQDHVGRLDPDGRRRRLEEIDARFRPSAYVLLRGGTSVVALANATLADGRNFIEVPSGDPAVQLFVLAQ